MDGAMSTLVPFAQVVRIGSVDISTIIDSETAGIAEASRNGSFTIAAKTRIAVQELRQTKIAVMEIEAIADPLRAHGYGDGR